MFEKLESHLASRNIILAKIIYYYGLKEIDLTIFDKTKKEMIDLEITDLNDFYCDIDGLILLVDEKIKEHQEQQDEKELTDKKREEKSEIAKKLAEILFN